MALCRNVKSILPIGLLALILLAWPAGAQFGSGKVAGWSGGLRTGGLLSVTELDDQVAFSSSVFLRRGLGKKIQGEVASGYGQFAGADYKSDMVMGEARLLVCPIVHPKWNPYLFGGIGVLRYDLATFPPARTPDASTIGMGATLPLGLGVQFALSASNLLEVSGGYTYTLRDDVNGAILEKGNDVFWTLTVGLIIGDFGIEGARPVERPMREGPHIRPVELRRPAESESQDGDGDGLSDWDEKNLYFTNPLMADSDGDRLSDGDEVEIYQTNPNRPDTDDGGVHDGEEFERGSDPLSAADDMFFGLPPLAEQPLRETAEQSVPSEEAVLSDLSVSPGKITFPLVINFSYGGAEFPQEVRRKLNAVAKVLLEDRGVLLEVRGYTDSVGRAEANLRLSRQRAEAVKDYLVKRGVAAWHLSVEGFGEARPIASNETLEGRQKNRRVELVIAQ